MSKHANLVMKTIEIASGLFKQREKESLKNCSQFPRNNDNNC